MEKKGNLTLSRKVNESIILSTSNGDIVVNVRRIGESQIKLAIEAPDSVSIARSELVENVT